MHSKIDVWQIDSKKELLPSEGVKALYTFDPYVEKIILSGKGSGALIRVGKELTTNWIEDNWLVETLFSDQDKFLILQSEDIGAESIKFILDNIAAIQSQNIIFCFGKNHEFFKKLVKTTVFTLSVGQPPYWKDRELLQFCLRQFNLQLAPTLLNFILATTIPVIGEFYSLANNLFLTFGTNQQISLDELKEVISANKVDQFKLIDLLATLKKGPFLEETLKLKLDYKEYEELFRMVQYHFLKMIDPTYIEKKKQPSKYDQEILKNSRLWTKEQMRRVLVYFKELELKAREKSIFLENELRITLLRLQQIK